MNCEEMLVDQVKLTKEASPGTSVWVYRNSVKALPVRFYVDFVFFGCYVAAGLTHRLWLRIERSGSRLSE